MLLIPLCPHFRLFCLLGKPSRQSWKSLILAGGRERFRVERRGSGLVGRGRKVRVDKDRGGEDDERVAPGRREEGLVGMSVTLVLGAVVVAVSCSPGC